MNLPNVRIADNGAAFLITVDGLTVVHKNSLGDAWRHIKWMYEVAQQKFTVGEKHTPVTEWIKSMSVWHSGTVLKGDELK